MRNKIQYINEAIKKAITGLAIIILLCIGYILYLAKNNNSLKVLIAANRDQLKKKEEEIKDLKSDKLIQPGINGDDLEMSPPITSLHPAANGFLLTEGLNRVARGKIKGKPLEAVVDIIFETNPSYIKNHYKNQSAVYGEELLKLNTNCFQNQICICDKLDTIPQYKPK